MRPTGVARENSRMGVWVELIGSDGRACLALPDPTGGTFDAAGDFDRLLGHSSASPVWSSIDTEGDTWLDAVQADQLISELSELIAQARPGPEERGLRRLSYLCERASTEGLTLRCVGD
jgi:hypothetical protein